MGQSNLKFCGAKSGLAALGNNLEVSFAEFRLGDERKSRLFVKDSAAADLDAHQVGLDHVNAQLLGLKVTN